MPTTFPLHGGAMRRWGGFNRWSWPGDLDVGHNCIQYFDDRRRNVQRDDRHGCDAAYSWEKALAALA